MNIELILLNFVYLLTKLIVSGEEVYDNSKNNSSINFEEYRTFLPADVFEEFVRIHSDNSLLLIDKLKQLNTIFVELPARTLSQIPLPRAFRRLPLIAQTTARRIYYSKWMPFDEKLTRLDTLVQNLQRTTTPVTRQAPEIIDDKNSFALPSEKDLASFVEFDVPVLLHFNGKIEMSQLERYLSPDEFDLLIRIMKNIDGDNTERSRLVGCLLKEAYARHGSSYFPRPQMDSQPQIGNTGGLPPVSASAVEDVTSLGIHLMFSHNDYDNIDPVANSYRLIKSGAIDYKSTNYDIDNGDYGDLPNRFYHRKHSQRQPTTDSNRAAYNSKAVNINGRENFPFRQKSDLLRMQNYHAIEMLNDEFTPKQQKINHKSRNNNFDRLRDFVASFTGNIHI